MANSDHHPHFAKLRSGIKIDTSGREMKPLVEQKLLPSFDPSMIGHTPTPYHFDLTSDVATFYH